MIIRKPWPLRLIDCADSLVYQAQKAASSGDLWRALRLSLAAVCISYPLYGLACIMLRLGFR